MDKEDINIYDGRFHYLNGLSFYYCKRDSRISFYVDTVSVKKQKKVRIDMFEEPGHGRPHVHVGKHNASFAIDDGSLLC